ncbi:Oxysterol-binding protein 4 [Mycoemilia scoparia]|uniref:Oxysterol-binding protein 4 n=1 Tax=Mycoemilia scoparia TaxID=417184 RepID=A0A9W7ZR24_9FUNG|nr:Oxysterol-binding protein 4 [Mycoemilia scoparia]
MTSQDSMYQAKPEDKPTNSEASSTTNLSAGGASGASAKENEMEPTGSIVSSNNQGAFMGFLKQLMTFTGDLSSMTCPSFLINGISLLEYSVHWCDFPGALSAIAKETDPAERMKRVSAWFVSTLYGSYYERVATKNTGEKKPFNPILGEQFLAKWENEEIGETTIVCEQVSHHPPVSALYLENEKLGIYGSGHFCQQSKFKGTTLKVAQEGRFTLRFKDSDEVYCFTLPELNICSVLTGKPFLEMRGQTWIRSNKGYTAQFEWHTKPWLHGEYHKFDGSIYKESSDAASSSTGLSVSSFFTLGSSAPTVQKDILYKMSGKWMEKSTVTNVKTGEEEVFFEVDPKKKEDMIVRPLSEQSDIESRKVWHKVAEAISKGEYDVATKEKTAIEEHQRALRRERNEKGIEWVPKLFTYIKDDIEHADVKDCYKYLYRLQPTVTVGSWVYKNSPHFTDSTKSAGSTAAASISESTNSGSFKSLQ